MQERTQEIGLLKAIDANQLVILTQFLIESIIVSVVRGAIDTGIGGIIIINIFSPMAV